MLRNIDRMYYNFGYGGLENTATNALISEKNAGTKSATKRSLDTNRTGKKSLNGKVFLLADCSTSLFRMIQQSFPGR